MTLDMTMLPTRLALDQVLVRPAGPLMLLSLGHLARPYCAAWNTSICFHPIIQRFRPFGRQRNGIVQGAVNVAFPTSRGNSQSSSTP